MEYAKDEVFNIYYNEKKDKLEYSLKRKHMKNFFNDKFMTLLITMGIVFGVLDFSLIYYFFEILSKM
ncbi:MAG: hypothetical protein HFJ57_02495 [Clostridia bacterium]|nr:hypothetical protein [Clostridia bacterium]